MSIFETYIKRYFTYTSKCSASKIEFAEEEIKIPKERDTRIELASFAWEANVLPLY